MAYSFRYSDTLVDPALDDLVSFVVIPQPASGIDVLRAGDQLSLSTLHNYLPHAHTIDEIRKQLKEKGFQVFEDPSPIVSARGTVEQFVSIFKAPLKKRIRSIQTQMSLLEPDGYDLDSYTVESVIAHPIVAPPDTVPIPGAVSLWPVSPPLFVEPALPPVLNEFHLRVPGDIAQLTGASATHRLSSRAGRATGASVGVALIDTGFAPHPYFQGHNYDIAAVPAADATHPMVDPNRHGTMTLAPLLACAPDVKAYGIKMGQNPILALDRAAMFPDIKVISLSWVYPLAEGEQLSRIMVALGIRLLTLVRAGKTIIAAAGNGQISFPAMMPEVISVGGAAFDESESLSVWDGASSFRSPIFRGRSVPDLCGIASPMLLPAPRSGSSAEAGWKSTSGTSFAAPQVAGIAALLIQKNPALTPEGIRNILCRTATDITRGSSGFGDPAEIGPDLATGAGLVNAHRAWLAVVSPPQSQASQGLGNIAALVFLRSVSGAVLCLNAPEVVVRVHRAFANAGFLVFPDVIGTTLSIEGPPSRFADYFNVPEESFESTLELPILETPDELKDDVEAVTLIRPPQFV